MHNSLESQEFLSEVMVEHLKNAPERRANETTFLYFFLIAVIIYILFSWLTDFVLFVLPIIPMTVLHLGSTHRKNTGDVIKRLCWMKTCKEDI